MIYLPIVLVGYLLGSIPWGFVLVGLVKGIDVRKHGSGNIGATNVVRIGGAPLGILAFILDAGKAALAVLVTRMLTDDPVADVLAAGMVVIGHSWPVFLKFKGGRGIAAACGGVGVLAPLAVGAGLFVFFVVVFTTRYSSLASLAGVVVAVIGLGIGMAVDHYSLVYLIFGFVLALFLVVRHGANIRRLVKGTELRFGYSDKRRKRPGRSSS
jgi:glycerol-3-phosphate acyltransferase PlsY